MIYALRKDPGRDRLAADEGSGPGSRERFGRIDELGNNAGYVLLNEVTASLIIDGHDYCPTCSNELLRYVGSL